MNKKLPDLKIRDLIINPPIIQGGMGVAVSKAKLAAAVSNTGALGVIASVGLGKKSKMKQEYEKASAEALENEIIAARKLTSGPMGVNIMATLNNYDSLVKVCVKNNAEVIISGSGLPLKLPRLVENSNIKLVPIVSSGRAAELICAVWQKRFKRLPDALVVEGPLAGGHLGFRLEELSNIENFTLERLVTDVLTVARKYERFLAMKIPVIAAGGIFDGKDIARMLKLGASGVQMATRFVCTYECDVSDAYKDAYLKTKKEDILIIDSPVGLPGRVIKNEFVERILKGEKIKFKCHYKCLKTCDEKTVSYCIADALVNSAKGDMKNGFAMCGTNAYRVKKIVSVKELIDELIVEASEEFNKDRK
ncbi:MAG: nitronate monooxygenase family protein [Candidatus Omnitrophota bacterium]